MGVSPKKKPGRVRITALPPETPAPWYSRTRACRHCEARVLRRLENPPRIRVQHEEGCPA